MSDLESTSQTSCSWDASSRNPIVLKPSRKNTCTGYHRTTSHFRPNVKHMVITQVLLHSFLVHQGNNTLVFRTHLIPRSTSASSLRGIIKLLNVNWGRDTLSRKLHFNRCLNGICRIALQDTSKVNVRRIYFHFKYHRRVAIWI